MATSSRDWKRPQNHELELPSGNVCLVKRPGMEVLLQAGVMPDNMAEIAQQAIRNAQKGPQDHKLDKKAEEDRVSSEMMEKFLANPNALNDVFVAFDKVCAMVIVEPPVEYHRVKEMDDHGNPRKDEEGNDVWSSIPLSQRKTGDDAPVYTDEIDSDDKEFIFQFVAGGTSDIERFRNERNDVADVQHGDDVPLPSE